MHADRLAEQLLDAVMRSDYVKEQEEDLKKINDENEEQLLLARQRRRGIIDFHLNHVRKGAAALRMMIVNGEDHPHVQIELALFEEMTDFLANLLDETNSEAPPPPPKSIEPDTIHKGA